MMTEQEYMAQQAQAQQQAQEPQQTQEPQPLDADIEAAFEESQQQGEESVQDIFFYAGKAYTLESFATANHMTLEQAYGTLEIMMKKHLVTGEITPPRDKKVEKAFKESQTIQQARNITQLEAQEKQYIYDTQRDKTMVQKYVDFDFPNTLRAQEFQTNANNMGLASEIYNYVNNTVRLRVYDVSAKEFTMLSRIYTANHYIEVGSRKLAQVTVNAASTVDYMSRNIVTPITKNAFGCAAKLGAVLVSSAARILGVGILAASKGIQEAAVTIKTDPDVTQARAELIQAKNCVSGTFNSNRFGTSNGIHVSDN